MYEPAAWCNLLLIVVTVVVSWLGFQHREIEEKYIFHPASILAGKEYYRLVTCAFLHAGWWHLGLNMVSLYSFGPAVEWYLGRGNFLFIYFGSVIGGSLLSLSCIATTNTWPTGLRAGFAASFSLTSSCSPELG